MAHKVHIYKIFIQILNKTKILNDSNKIHENVIYESGILFIEFILLLNLW